MKKLIKKSVAIIEVAAMTLALVVGINLGTVKAADGELTVNEAVSVSADAGGSVTYTFTAPEDGTYYFTSEGEYDTYGYLYVGDESYIDDDDDDDGVGFNFMIAYDLTEGQECSVKVKEVDGESFACDLVVYDSETASTISTGFVDMGDNEDYYCNLGESVTLGVKLTNLVGDELDFPEGYTFEWYKYSSVNGTTKLEETGNTYTIAEVSAEELYEQEDWVYYYVSIYKDGEEVDQIYAYIYDKSSYMEVAGEDYDVSIGDKVVLEPIAYDYDGNEIDLSGDEYTFEWYKALEEDYELVGEELTYTIDSVTQEDLFDEDSYSQYYTVLIYKNGEFIESANFYLYEKEEESSTEAPTTEAPTTEAPTTEAPTTEAPTTEAPTTEAPTTKQDTTTVAPTTTASEKVKAPAKAKITKVNAKKKAAKKVKISLKKIKGANGYQVAIYKTKKNAKKNKKAIVKKFVKKTKVTINSNKLKNKKALFVKARAYTLNGKTKVYGKWSTVKKVEIKK